MVYIFQKRKKEIKIKIKTNKKYFPSIKGLIDFILNCGCEQMKVYVLLFAL